MRAPSAPRTSGAAHAPARSELQHLGPGGGGGVSLAVGAAGAPGRRVRPRSGAETELAPPDRAPGGQGAAVMPSENIFLFVPNLIGECCPRLRADGRERGPGQPS